MSTTSPRTLLSDLYRSMLRIRLFEEAAALLVERGELRTPCHLYIGQEAIAAGVCAALGPEDYVWGGHRSHGHYLAKGGDLRALMDELFGKVTGCSRGRGGSMHLVAPEVGILGTVPLVAATIPLAAGAALAAKLRQESRVSVAFFGDGATEEGHFHESLNMAAVYHLPAIFVCENNFYASHMSLAERRASDNIDQAAAAHGIRGARIDGNDVLAVFEAASAAVASARSGLGASLLECRTYRWRGHAGPSWDEDVGVRRKGELKDWLPRDPVGRARNQLQLMGMEPSFFQLTEREIREEVAAAVDSARLARLPDESELGRHVFV